MMSAGFSPLRALLVVAMAGSSFGGGSEECYVRNVQESNGMYWEHWFGMEADSKRLVVQGRGGMCLAVYGGPGVDFASAANTCNVSFVGGRLLTRDSWGVFLKARDNSEGLAGFNKTIYVGFSPQSESGCFVIDQQLKVTSEEPCQMQRRSFVCEYPRQEFCVWESMREEAPVRRPDGQWELREEVFRLLGSEDYCMPSKFSTQLVSAKLAACRPLYKDAWSEWGKCAPCGDDGRYMGSQLRSRELTDRCDQLVSDERLNKYDAHPDLFRYHRRSCYHLPCGTDATTGTDVKTTEGGASVISISHLPMLFVFLSMFSY